MNLKSYETLSKLLLGLLLSFMITKVYFPDYEIDKFGNIIFLTAIGYVVGYFIDTMSSWFETIYFKTWGGKPSAQLMKGRGMKKVTSLSNIECIKQNIRGNVVGVIDNDEELFRVALSDSANSRAPEFQNLYAFSRSLLTTLIISFLTLVPKFYNIWYFYALSLLIILIAWHRAKQKAYYFAREVLVNASLKKD